MAIDEEYFKTDNPMKQNTVEDIIDEDERILLRLKPNRKVLMLEAIFKGLPIVLLWAGFDTAMIVLMVTNGVFAEQPALLPFIIVFFALHLLPLWKYIAHIIKINAGYKNIEYVFTDRRILLRSGLIGIDFKSIFYTSIQSVNLKVGLFDRIFKVGDIYIKTADQSAVIEDIEQPYFYLGRLQKIALDMKADIYYPNGLRPEENPGYRTHYTGDKEDK